MKEGDFVVLPYSTRNPIKYSIPVLLSQDAGPVKIDAGTTILPDHGSVLTKLMNIWSTDWIHQSLYHDGDFFPS
jgi:DNA helicase INO80